jgi:hypothetical protein
MIKIRMALDELLRNKDLHFTLDVNKNLVIAGKCNKTYVTFSDIELPKNPTNKELDYVRNILLKNIDDINDKLDKLVDLEKSKPERVYVDGYSNNHYLSLKEGVNRIYFDIDTFEIEDYVVTFKDKKDIDKVIKELNNRLEDYKKYVTWEKAYKEITNELNSCKI